MGALDFDRRQVLVHPLLATGGVLLAGSRAALRAGPGPRGTRLDRLLEAHADVLPEGVGSGANHYPMAAEALEALGYEEAIEDSWSRSAAGYAGRLPRVSPITTDEEALEALGAYERFGDWLDFFRAALAGAAWREVVAAWAPRLAPGMSGAALHGLIRTGHAARALRLSDTDARRNELAVALAYWAARYTKLPTTGKRIDAGASLLEVLASLEHPWLDRNEAVDFFAVSDRLVESPIAPAVAPAELDFPRVTLSDTVNAAATAFLEMLVLERHRIWLLHTVTGPAAVELLLEDVDEAGARALVAYARQAVVALYVAYGAPFEARAHLDPAPPAWPELIEPAVESRSVHTIKLVEALVRMEQPDDPLFRNVATRWLAWK